MNYEGPHTDINYGAKYADKYGFLTNKDVNILKVHGNLVVGLTRFNKTLEKICKERFKKSLFSKIKSEADYQKTYDDCEKVLADVCGRLVGFDVKFRSRGPSYMNDWSAMTVVIYKANGNYDYDEE